MCLLSTKTNSQETEEAVAEEDQEILPGGDPDAGMPAEQAEIHGIKRGSPPPLTEQSERPVPTDGIDNIDEVENNVENTEVSTVTQPPDSD